MTTYKTLFTTDRSAFHQQRVLDAAPDNLNVKLLYRPDRERLQLALADTVYWVSERAGKIDNEMLMSAPKLRLVQRLGRLTHDIDTDTAKARGVAVAYMPISSVIRVAEHVIMQMLVLANRVRQVEQVALAAADTWGERVRTDENTFRFNWSKQQNLRGLSRTTVGILGFGEIGVELAARLKGWECTVLYNKRSRYPDAVEAAHNLINAEKRTIFEKSDFVVNLLPYSSETAMSIDAAALATMRDDAFFVSAGSGGIVDEAALAKVLEGGKLGGAALDTFDYEPLPPDSPLIPLAKAGGNVLLTPHTAAAGHSADNGRAYDYENIQRHIRGELLRYQVV
jgi:phosphoglycerate dehydrogenase-like enzyme